MPCCKYRVGGWARGERGGHVTSVGNSYSAAAVDPILKPVGGRGRPPPRPCMCLIVPALPWHSAEALRGYADALLPLRSAALPPTQALSRFCPARAYVAFCLQGVALAGLRCASGLAGGCARCAPRRALHTRSTRHSVQSFLNSKNAHLPMIRCTGRPHVMSSLDAHLQVGGWARSCWG